MIDRREVDRGWTIGWLGVVPTAQPAAFWGKLVFNS